MRSATGLRSLILTSSAFLLALLVGEPALAMLAVPYLVGLRGLLRSQPHAVRLDPQVSATMEPAHLVEGGRTYLLVHVDAPGATLVRVSAQLSEIAKPAGIDVLLTAHSGRTSVTVPVLASRRGRLALSALQITVSDSDGLIMHDTSRRGRMASAVVRPAQRRMRSRASFPPRPTAMGTHPSAMRGQGDDFAGLREYAAGDDLRRVNWSATARTDAVWVSEHHSERATDVVLAIGTAHVSELTVDAAARQAAALVEHFLHRGDRVWLVELGWRPRRTPALQGRSGRVSGHEWLSDLRASPRYTGWRPEHTARMIAPQALVIILATLQDSEVLTLAAALRRRGQQVLILEPPAEPRMPPSRPDPGGATAHVAEANDLDEPTVEELTSALSRLRTQARAASLQRHGIPVIPATAPDPLALAAKVLAGPRGHGCGGLQ